MSDLRDLYQEVILDHGRRPRNFHRIPQATRRVEGYNPLCGDHFTLYLTLEGDVVKDVAFEGSGCAISTASASMMTQSVKGKTIEEAKALFQKFHGLLTGESPDVVETENGPPLGKLEVFSGVCEYPTRVKCATLAWHTLNAALENRDETVSTE
jgi:nitrogen fixation NifU-like protein